jgi:short-subunit dehydrogenase
MDKVLIVGATSGIASATAREFAKRGASLFLVGRDAERLSAVAADLRVLGAAVVRTSCWEATDLDAIDTLLGDAVAGLGGLDAVLIAHGMLPDQERCESDPDELMRTLTINGLSVVRLAMRIADLFERQRRGCLAVLGSAAGERGRRSTYIYGMAKGLVTVCLQGLRARLFPAGVSVLTIFPVFVDTQMTAHLPARARRVSPRLAGRRIHRAMLRGADVIYVPRYWRFAVWLARNLPEAWFKRSRMEQRYLERVKGAASAGRAARTVDAGDSST